MFADLALGMKLSSLSHPSVGSVGPARMWADLLPLPSWLLAEQETWANRLASLRHPLRSQLQNKMATSTLASVSMIYMNVNLL